MFRPIRIVRCKTCGGGDGVWECDGCIRTTIVTIVLKVLDRTRNIILQHNITIHQESRKKREREGRQRGRKKRRPVTLSVYTTHTLAAASA